LKKAHLLRCARSPRSNVSVNTPPLVDFSRASHLDPFEQPEIRFFNNLLTIGSKQFPAANERSLCPFASVDAGFDVL
jgi:hypothetical protein